MSLREDPQSLLDDHCICCGNVTEDDGEHLLLCQRCKDTEAAHGMEFEIGCAVCGVDITVTYEDLPLCRLCKATAKAHSRVIAAEREWKADGSP